jgi:hypothetical protein
LKWPTEKREKKNKKIKKIKEPCLCVVCDLCKNSFFSFLLFITLINSRSEEPKGTWRSPSSPDPPPPDHVELLGYLEQAWCTRGSPNLFRIPSFPFRWKPNFLLLRIFVRVNLEMGFKLNSWSILKEICFFIYYFLCRVISWDPFENLK